AVWFSGSLCFVVFVFFFFQAEDGIRDRNVTGVQTCALPISFHIDGDQITGRRTCRSNTDNVINDDNITSYNVRSAYIIKILTLRSEERRVGKECRCGLWWYQYREKREQREEYCLVIIQASET